MLYSVSKYLCMMIVNYCHLEWPNAGVSIALTIIFSYFTCKLNICIHLYTL